MIKRPQIADNAAGGEKALTLSELLERAERCVADEFPCGELVTGQTADLKVNYNGHCYFDLVETDAGGSVKAKARAVIWASAYRRIAPVFEASTGSPLQSGMKVLVSCQVQFTRLYGLSLIIDDIDPSYTVGEAEAEKRRTIEKLDAAGLIGKNGSLPLPRLPRVFAVISSEGAAGYRDFMRHLHENGAGFSFITVLFRAAMQGKEAPSEITAALDGIRKASEGGRKFDAVMIIRGGGSSVDLSCFDDYALCRAVAEFPLPVFTGIGHDKDYHVCDMVAAVNVKTPTALADYVLEIFENEEAYIESVSERLSRSFRSKAMLTEQSLDRIFEKMRSAVKLRLSDLGHYLDRCALRLEANPLAALGRGMALAEGGGGRLESVDDVTAGDLIRVALKDGVLICEVKNKEK